MSYGWGQQSWSRSKLLDFTERSWKWADMAAWDARWQTLSAAARSALLLDVKAPAQTYYGVTAPDGGTPASKFAPEVLKELTEAGFVRVEPGQAKLKGKGKPAVDRVVTEKGAGEFRVRVRALNRIHVLDPAHRDGLQKFLNVAASPSRLVPFVSAVLRDAGIEVNLDNGDALAYLTSARWPDLALKAIDDPLAARVLAAVRDSGAPVPVADLAKRVKKADPVKVREALDLLIKHMVVFEDLSRSDLTIEVGLLPAVRERIAAAASRKGRPALVACEAPFATGPDAGPAVDDLRALLLEVASEPPRLRQDGEIFSKEKERFYQALQPLPTWLVQALGESWEARLGKTYNDARALALVKQHPEGEQVRLQLTPKGKAWLSSEIKDQYAQVYEGFRVPPKKNNTPAVRVGYDGDDDVDDDLDESEFDPYYIRRYDYPVSTWDDRAFLGSTLTVVTPAAGKKAVYGSPSPTQKDIEALRLAIGRALNALPEGVFYRLDAVAEHLTFGDQNVLLLGRAQEQVKVSVDYRNVPPLEEAREAAGRKALTALALGRLIPLGALRAAVDAGGRLLVARTPRLGAYFGLEPMPEMTGSGASGGEKVVIQPDFSVVVIGLGTAALAELAPFCERQASGKKGPGASVMTITRDSVVRAIAQGLKPEQIVDRLRKHASHEPPANVLREVREWGQWVKPVTTARLTVLRCPDRETADRVAGVLKRKLERLNDTTLALDTERLLPAERKKLRDNGILLGASADTPARPGGSYAPAARRRSW